MNDFSIKPDVISIAKSKKRFLYIGIGILIFNFYCVIGYIQLALNGELVGYYLFIFALVNLHYLLYQLFCYLYRDCIGDIMRDWNTSLMIKS